MSLKSVSGDEYARLRQDNMKKNERIRELEDRLDKWIYYSSTLSSDNERIGAAAQEVVDRWDTPSWKDAQPTAEVIYRLRDALANFNKRKKAEGLIECIKESFTTPPDDFIFMKTDTPRTDAIGIDHLTATEREYKLRKLAMELERENARLREIIEAVARDLVKGDAVAFQCYIDLNETIIDLYGKEISLPNVQALAQPGRNQTPTP